jgi:hypothetical protein
VHFAGHEVPAYQPEKALVLFENFLNGSLFDNYPAGIYSSSSSPSDDMASSETSTSVTTAGGSHLVPVIIAVLLILTSIGGLVVCFMPKPSSSSAVATGNDGESFTESPKRKKKPMSHREEI